MLLLEPGHLITVPRLAAVVWGDEPPPSALKNLQGHVHRLRRALADAPGVRLRTGGSAYALDTDPDQVDLHRFRRLTEAARAAEPATAAPLLTEALTLWRGPAMADLNTPAVRAIAARLDEERLLAEEWRLEAELELGRHAETAAALARLVETHPLRERTRALLMLALFRCGRRADALGQYRDARRLLAAELGVEPGPDLRAMHDRILHDDPSLNPRPLPAGPLGQPGRAADRPVPSELPHTAGCFTGRGGELAELDGLLSLHAADDSTAVITSVDGMGGVGKTALVLTWAQRVRRHFPDGVLHVDLHGHDPHQPPLPVQEALAQLLGSLGAAGDVLPEGLDERARRYRSLLGDRRLLIVLDNAASAAQVRPLLPGSPNCFTVVTSRACLVGLVATEGAHRISLGPLPAQDAQALLAALVGTDRVDAQPGAAAVAAALCGHVPLALRIAAAHLVAHPELGLDTLATELRQGDRLSLLGVEGDADLRMVFDLSYRTLRPTAQLMFRRLGDFPGSDLTVEAAAALAGVDGERAASDLSELAEAHLVEEPSPGRLAMHDLVRQYAAERAAEDNAGERTAAAARLLLWYLAHVRTACRILGIPRLLVYEADLPVPPLRPQAPATEEEASGWLETERGNMVAVICQGVARGTGAPGWHLALELRGFFRLRRYTADWVGTAAAALEEARHCGDLQAQAALAHSLGHARWSVGEYAQAVVHYRQALEESRRAGWPDGQVGSLSALGAVHHDAGRAEEAVDCYRQALAMIDRRTAPAMELITVGSLGLAYQSLGRLPEAVECFTRVLQMSEQAEAHDQIATSLGNIGMCLRDMGDFREARERLNRALDLYRQVGSRNGEANVLTGLAEVDAETGNYDDAAYQSLLALRLARDIGDRRIESDALAVSGLACARRGDLGGARSRLAEAVRLAEETGYGRGLAAPLAELARVQLRAGQSDAAANSARRALELARAARHQPDEAKALTVLAAVELANGDYHCARRCANQALELNRQLRLRLGEAQSLRVLGDVAQAVQGTQHALPHWQQALDILTRTGSPEVQELRRAIATAPVGG